MREKWPVLLAFNCNINVYWSLISLSITVKTLGRYNMLGNFHNNLVLPWHLGIISFVLLLSEHLVGLKATLVVEWVQLRGFLCTVKPATSSVFIAIFIGNSLFKSSTKIAILYIRGSRIKHFYSLHMCHYFSCTDVKLSRLLMEFRLALSG